MDMVTDTDMDTDMDMDMDMDMDTDMDMEIMVTVMKDITQMMKLKFLCSEELLIKRSQNGGRKRNRGNHHF